MTKSMIIRAIGATLENWENNCKDQKNYIEAKQHVEDWLKDLEASV